MFLLGFAFVLLFTGCMTQRGPSQPESPSPSPPFQETGYDNPNRAKADDDKKGSSNSKPAIDSIGFLEPTDPAQAAKLVKQVGDDLTYVAFFSYRVKSDGSLIPLKDESSLQAIRQTKAKPMLVITNFAGGTFSPDIAHDILTDREAASRLINNVIQVMKAKKYAALNIDFEHILPEDRDRYTQFLKTLTPKVKAAGFTVSTALAPKISGEQTGPWYTAHDYGAHAKIVDFVILMTYEWGWTGGPPMAVAPIDQVKSVIDYAVSVIPKDKIIMGAPLYGYDWGLPYKKGGPPAKRLGPQEAADLAKKEGAAVQYETRAQAPFFRYTDDNGKKHIVWFENDRSMQAKFDLIKQYGLRGIAYWELGESFPKNWELLKKNFQINRG
jgi:spore germination protein